MKSVVVVLISALAATSLLAAAHGAPLPASINVKFQNSDGSGLRDPTGPEEQAIADELSIRLARDSETLFDRTPGWDCLLSARLRREWVVEVGVVVWTPDPAAAGPASVHSLNVAVTVKGGRENNTSIGPRTALPPGRNIGAMQFEANQQLDRAVRELQGRGIKPCEPKAKVKGKRTVTQEGARVNYEWEGEESLRLGRDGAFEASLPIKMQVNSSVEGCTITAAIDIRLTVTGSYRENGRLVFTKMDSTQMPSTAMLRCPDTPPRSVALRPWWGGNWMHEGEVGVPLEDGARVSLRPQWLVAEPGTGEMTLELEFGRGTGTPVATVPVKRSVKRGG